MEYIVILSDYRKEDWGEDTLIPIKTFGPFNTEESAWGNKWNTYLQIDHQGFTVVEQTTKKQAEFFGEMLAIALSRVTTE
jgi:hypothetical protein